MLNTPKKKSNTFTQRVHDAYNHDIRKAICITTSLTALLCKISLQFCCEFIDNNRSNISFIWDITNLITLPTSILYILHSGFNLAEYKSKSKSGDKDKPKELGEVISKSVSLASTIIGVLMQMKIIHLLAPSAVSYVKLISTILFLFISEPISYYYTCKEYQDKKSADKSNECKKELAKCKKDLMISRLTLSLGLLNFVLKRIETATIPVNLGNGVIYNFNLSITISIMYSTVFLILNVEKLFNQPVNGTDPSTGLEDVHQHGVNSYTVSDNAV